MKISGEHQGQDVGQQQHDRLRDDGEDKRVLQRGAEGGVVERIAEIPHPHEVDALVPDRDVAQTVEDRQHQRDADQRDDVDDRGQEQHRSQHTLPVEPVATLPRLSESRRIHLGARAHGRLPLRSSRSPVSR